MGQYKVIDNLFKSRKFQRQQTVPSPLYSWEGKQWEEESVFKTITLCIESEKNKKSEKFRSNPPKSSITNAS